MSDKKITKQDNSRQIKKADLLQSIQLTEEKRNELLLETFGEALLKKIPLLGSLIDHAQQYQNKVNSARLAVLLSKFEEQISSFEKFRDILGKLLTSNAGIMLFHKTVRIVNTGNFEQEYIELLAKTLKHISESDFEDLFNEHDYALSQIEKLSPQALLVLSSFESWRGISLQGGTTMSGQTIVGNWDDQVTNFFARSKNIEDERIKRRLAHAFRELENNRMLYLTGNKNIALSPIGTEVYGYIS